MRKTFLLVAVLMTAGTVHAQGSLSSGGGLNSVNGITSYRIATMRCDSAVDQRSSQMIGAKNDGPFLPTSFADYDRAIEIGQLAANARPPRLGEVARSVREQKMTARQSAVLIVEQDQYGRMVISSQVN
jgi:hypothetical protein